MALGEWVVIIFGRSSSGAEKLLLYTPKCEELLRKEVVFLEKELFIVKTFEHYFLKLFTLPRCAATFRLTKRTIWLTLFEIFFPHLV